MCISIQLTFAFWKYPIHLSVSYLYWKPLIIYVMRFPSDMICHFSLRPRSLVSEKIILFCDKHILIKWKTLRCKTIKYHMYTWVMPKYLFEIFYDRKKVISDEGHFVGTNTEVSCFKTMKHNAFYNQNMFTTDSGNGFTPNKRQAFTWINVEWLSVRQSLKFEQSTIFFPQRNQSILRCRLKNYLHFALHCPGLCVSSSSHGHDDPIAVILLSDKWISVRGSGR